MLKKVFIISEIGINHNGDMQIAKKLMDAINACGWDCAKYQKRNPDVCVPEKQKVIMKHFELLKIQIVFLNDNLFCVTRRSQRFTFTEL